MAISTFFPKVQPSLTLNFARSKKLDPRIAFSRASTGTRLNQFGIIETVGINNPRFDHSYSATGGITCQGLLIENTATNLLLFSEQFDHPLWTKTNLSVGIGSAIAPNGLTTAYSLTDNTTSGVHTVGQALTVTQTTTISYSCFARAGLGSTGFAIGLTLSGGSFTNPAQIVVDLDTGVGITSLYTAGIYTSFIQPYPNKWYRIGLAATAVSTAVAGFTISMVQKSGSTGILTYVGAGSTILIWGAQAEISPAPTSYIRSDASSGIRSGDLAYIDLNPYPSWYNPLQGSLLFQHGFVGFSTTTSAGYPAVGFASTNGQSPYANQYFFDRSGNRTSVYLVRNNGTDISNINYFAPTAPGFSAAKVGFAYTSNLFNLVRNGASIGVGIGSTVPPAGSLLIGNNGKDITSNINSTIAVMSYYPVALSTSQLQNLTR